MIDLRGLQEILTPSTFNKVKEEVTDWVISQMSFEVPTSERSAGKRSMGKSQRTRGRMPAATKGSASSRRNAPATGGGRGKPQAIKLVGGKQFQTIAEAVEATGIPYLTIRKSAQSGEQIKRGPHKGKRFVYA